MILVIEILIITDADIHYNEFDFYVQLPAQVLGGGAE